MEAVVTEGLVEQVGPSEGSAEEVPEHCEAHGTAFIPRAPVDAETAALADAAQGPPGRLPGPPCAGAP